MIAAVSAQGQLHGQARERAFDAVAVTEFLRHLLRVVAGPVLVIWDGAPIHRSKIVKAFLQAQGAGCLELEPLPGYAPDLHPLDCGVWHWLEKRGASQRRHDEPGRVEAGTVCGYCASAPQAQRDQSQL